MPLVQIGSSHAGHTQSHSPIYLLPTVA